MVGWLVEQQRLWMSEERLCQQHAHFLTALDLRHLPRVQVVRDIEPLQQNRGVAFRCVPVLLADDAFELAEAHAVGLGHLGLGVEELPFFERAPQTLVPHDDRVDHAELIEGELVLAEDAKLVGPRDRALLRGQLARQQLHERRLAGAVGACEAVAPAGGEGGRDVLEEHLRAVAHGDIADRDHRGHANRCRPSWWPGTLHFSATARQPQRLWRILNRPACRAATESLKVRRSDRSKLPWGPLN